ncbi:MAG TPA: AAA family ATPase [Clostridiales bacterium]|nr:AAA family ATPase [Clostridiales bacterium]
MNEKEVVFKGVVVNCIYNSESFKVYAVDVDKEKYPTIKLTKYSNATVSGNLHELGSGVEYNITAIEEKGKYGYGYKVVNIKRDKPSTSLDIKIFLSEILTPKQADVLYDAYPDIVDRVINNDIDDIDLNKTKGIKEYTFSIIKEKIIENFVLVELVSEFQGLLSLSMVKKLYEKYPSVKKVRSELKLNPYKCLCGLSGVGFKTADSLLLDVDNVSKENIKKGLKPIIEFEFDLRTSEQRCLACVLYLLDENENDGHTKMSLIELKQQCDKLVPACSQYFTDVIKDDSVFYDKGATVAALNSTYETEKYIADSISEGLKSNWVWDYDCEQYRMIDDIPLSDEQMNALYNLCKYNISILNGNAGSGKSFATQSIVKLLRDNNKSFRLMCPTGKASKVLSAYTKEDATTIHRGLGYIPPNVWSYNKEEKLMCDVLIIDEFSMVDIFLFKRVIDAIDFSKTKLLIIGDNAQLPSVSCGNLLHDFMQSKIIPTTTLTKIFRYGEGGLMKVATDVRNSKAYLNKDNIKLGTYFGTNQDYAFINVDQSVLVKNVVALYKKLLAQEYTVEDIQVLTSYNKGEYGTIKLNNHLQRVANKNYGSDGLKHGEVTYYKGDLVIQKVNNYKAKLYVDDGLFILDKDEEETFIANGETGTIIETGQHEMIIDFDGVKVIYTRDDLNGVGLGYSISTHKSQGGSSKVIIFLTPKAHTYMLNSNLIYVGLTRMKEKCFHLGDVNTLNRAIKKKENFDRRTFMKNFLINIQ